ncbi:MAG: hypothetical protein H0U75_01745 [Legionella sp.]|nr:hypothetical protein [Legionella sp.]
MIKIKSLKWAYGLLPLLAANLTSCYMDGQSTPPADEAYKNRVISTGKGGVKNVVHSAATPTEHVATHTSSKVVRQSNPTSEPAPSVPPDSTSTPTQIPPME